MPPRYARVPEINQVPSDTAAMVQAVNRAIRAINEVLVELATADSQFRGNDGYTPAFNSDVNLQDRRLKNIARSKDGGDAVTRRELEEIGILGNAGGVVFSSPVTFGAGASSQAAGGDGSELPTTTDMIDTINQLVQEAISVAFAGEAISIQTYGRVGRTAGQLVMGRNGNGRAEIPEVRNGHLMVHSYEVITLLELINQRLETLCNAIPDYRGANRSRSRRYYAITSTDDLD